MTTKRLVTMAEMTEEQLRIHQAGKALHRDGGSPAGTLELIAAIVEDGTWRKVADVKGAPFDGRFRDFVSARPPYGLGCEPAQLLKVIELRHPHESVQRISVRMNAMRGRVRALLLESLAAAATAGGDRRSGDFQVGGTNLKPNQADHVVARLKREDPVLAERVTRGEISANAAAQEKGWRHPRIVVSSPERVAEALRRTMEPADLTRLAEILSMG